jgi:hypothetical protein
MNYKYRIKQGPDWVNASQDKWRVERQGWFGSWHMIDYGNSFDQAEEIVRRLTSPISDKTFYYDRSGVRI